MKNATILLLLSGATLSVVGCTTVPDRVYGQTGYQAPVPWSELVMFDGGNFSGPVVATSEPIDRLDFAGFNDVVASIDIRGDGYGWLLCTDAYFEGPCLVARRSIADLDDLAMDDKISSVLPLGRDNPYPHGTIFSLNSYGDLVFYEPGLFGSLVELDPYDSWGTYAYDYGYVDDYRPGRYGDYGRYGTYITFNPFIDFGHNHRASRLYRDRWAWRQAHRRDGRRYAGHHDRRDDTNAHPGRDSREWGRDQRRSDHDRRGDDDWNRGRRRGADDQDRGHNRDGDRGRDRNRDRDEANDRGRNRDRDRRDQNAGRGQNNDRGQTDRDRGQGRNTGGQRPIPTPMSPPPRNDDLIGGPDANDRSLPPGVRAVRRDQTRDANSIGRITPEQREVLERGRRDAANAEAQRRRDAQQAERNRQAREQRNADDRQRLNAEMQRRREEAERMQAQQADTERQQRQRAAQAERQAEARRQANRNARAQQSIPDRRQEQRTVASPPPPPPVASPPPPPPMPRVQRPTESKQQRFNRNMQHEK